MAMMKLFTAMVAATCLGLAATPTALSDPFRIIVTSTEVPLVPNSVLYLAESEGYFDRARRRGRARAGGTNANGRQPHC